jgi:conjugal transfer mating pair stabilization protein TraN
MYEENNVTYRVGINWKDIIIKVILLIIFLVLLIWLFPRNDMEVFYDEVYRDNINTMKEAATSYYTKSRLPQTVGSKTSMTLKEMIDNHLLIRFTDKNKKYCDETSSKVEVTKTSEDEYVLKVELNCGSQKDYILETIGCHDTCVGTNCTKETKKDDEVSKKEDDKNTGDGAYTIPSSEVYGEDVSVKGNIYKVKTTYYQFRKAIVTSKVSYTCPSGYVLNGTKCTRTATGATIDATPVYGPDQTITTDAKKSDGSSKVVYTDPIKTKTGTEYSCPEGYTRNGSYCIKYTDATPSSNVTYTCPSGYTLNGTSCYKLTSATKQNHYSCPNGGTLQGDKCVVTQTRDESYNATPHTTYSCPNGGSLSGTQCIVTSSYAATPKVVYGAWQNAGVKYYTSSGKAYTGTTSKLVLQGAISGAACGAPCGNKGIWYKYIYYTRSQSTTYSCPNGGTLQGSQCVKSSSYAATPKTTYSCPNGGTLSGTRCIKQGTTTSSYPAKNDVTYTCPNGGVLEGTQCRITIAATPSSNVTYSCPNGGVLEGNKCKITINATPKDVYTYTCPEGYTKSGEGENTKCSKTISTPGEYYCEDAEAKLQGDKCVKVIKGKIDHYTCPDDSYTLYGDKCVKNTTETIDATATTTYQTSYQYTWSKSTTLAGWEFTGKTKVVESDYVAGQQ